MDQRGSRAIRYRKSAAKQIPADYFQINRIALARVCEKANILYSFHVRRVFPKGKEEVENGINCYILSPFDRISADILKKSLEAKRSLEGNGVADAVYNAMENAPHFKKCVGL